LSLLLCMLYCGTVPVRVLVLLLLMLLLLCRSRGGLLHLGNVRGSLALSLPIRQRCSMASVHSYSYAWKMK
jgi:hypothetical protein